MNEHYFGQQMNPSIVVEEAASEAEATIGPTYVPLADEIPMIETPFKDISMVEPAVVMPDPLGETIVSDIPMINPIPVKAVVDTIAGSATALITQEESEHFRTRWNEIQGMFVDEPRSAVQQADALVSEVMEQITQMFSSEHSLLEGQWKQGEDVSTEDLRNALKRYRSFFNRLVV